MPEKMSLESYLEDHREKSADQRAGRKSLEQDRYRQTIGADLPLSTLPAEKIGTGITGSPQKQAAETKPDVTDTWAWLSVAPRRSGFWPSLPHRAHCFIDLIQ